MAKEINFSPLQKEQKNAYKLHCFISGSITERLNNLHKRLLDPISDLIKKKTKERGFYRLEFELNLTRLDQSPFIAEFIQKNVFDNIRQSHFLIADISPQFEEIENGEDKDNKNISKCSPNPSVMHEIGYAMALNIPVFLIGEKNTKDYLPANLRGSLVIEYDSKIHNSAGNKEIEDLISDEAANEFANNLAEIILNRIKVAGAPMTPGDFISQGYIIRCKVNLPYLIRGSRHRVYILTTNLQYINTRLKDALVYALNKNLKSSDSLGEAPNKSFKIDILTMEPESVFTNIRAEELNRSVFDFREELRKNLKEMKNLLKDYTNFDNTHNFEVSTYDSFPNLDMFVIDDTVIISIPCSAQRSHLVPHFMIADNSRIIQQFIDYFFVIKSRTKSQKLIIPLKTKKEKPINRHDLVSQLRGCLKKQDQPTPTDTDIELMREERLVEKYIK